MPDVVSDASRHGAAVEAAMEDDDVGPAGGLAAEPKCRLDGLAPGVGEEQAVQPRRQDLAQSLDKREQRTVHDGGVLRMDQRADLSLRRFDHTRVTVAGAGHADPSGEVEVSAIVLVVEQNALTAGREHTGRLFEDLRELRGGHGVPLVYRR